MLTGQRFLRSLIVSLHGHTAELYERVSGRAGVLDRVKRAIDAILRNGLELRLNVSLLRDNAAGVHELIDFIEARFKVPYRVATIVHTGRGASLAPGGISCGEAARILVDIDRRYPKSSVAQWAEAGVRAVECRTPCGVGEDFLFVSASGHIYICPTLTEREVPNAVLGHVASNPVGQVWTDSSLLRRFRETQCWGLAACEHRQECRGGCRSRAYVESGGDFGARDTVACTFYDLKRESVAAL